MFVTLNDFVRAGAIGQLVQYFHHCGGRDNDWEQVTLYAYREWRHAEPAVITALVRMAKASKVAADIQASLKDGECLHPSCIPGERLS